MNIYAGLIFLIGLVTQRSKKKYYRSYILMVMGLHHGEGMKTVWIILIFVHVYVYIIFTEVRSLILRGYSLKRNCSWRSTVDSFV